MNEHTLKVARTVKKDVNANGRLTAINALYKELYAMDEAYIDGVYYMVSGAFEEVWKARGSHFDQIIRVLDDALPKNVWRVNGKPFTRFAAFTGDDILEAQIMSMLSYIRLTEVKYLEGYTRDA